jgi:hypothetical protein
MRGWIVAGLVLTVSVPWAAAEPKERDRRKVDAEVTDVLAVIGPLVEALGATEARTQEAPRLLAEALRTGNTDTAAWASIVRWVLFEKEEKVAAGLTEALRAVPAPTSAPTPNAGTVRRRRSSAPSPVCCATRSPTRAAMATRS